MASMTQTEYNAQVIRRIESMFGSIADNLYLEQSISISLKSKKRKQTQVQNQNSSSSGTRAEGFDPLLEGSKIVESDHFKISLPGKRAEEAWRFAVVFTILGLIYKAIKSNTVISKRNIFYQDPTLFETQAVVDRYVDVIAYTFDVPRSGLNVSAVAKGLVVGHLSLTRPDGSVVEKGVDGKPFLVDDASDVVASRAIDASWILVVEKESTFRNLFALYSKIVSQVGNGVIMTAKGYPDLSSRSLLHHIQAINPADDRPPPPVLALMDYDPDGIAIMSTYKYGSSTLSHETSHLQCPGLQWTGLKSQDAMDVDESQSSVDIAAGQSGEQKSGFLMMSDRDRTKAIKMLENNTAVQEGGAESDWRRELQVMLIFNLKAEMEILDSNQKPGMLEWIVAKFFDMTGRKMKDVD